MWGWVPQTGDEIMFRPSAVTGTITDDSKAWDIDASPWSTAAVKALVSGSTVAGTPDTDTVDFNIFPTYSKANFGNCNLSIVTSYNLNSVGTNGIFVARAAILVEYSADGGTTWTEIFMDGSTGKPSGTIDLAYPAVEYIGATIVNVGNTSVTKSLHTVVIPSSSFTTGIQDLHVRVSLSTLKSTTAGNPLSSGEYSVWDIRATVS